MEIINTRWKHSLHIYTDGSLNPNTKKVGCSIYIPYFKYSKYVRINDYTSIYTAELFAVLLALEWIEEFQPLHVCIFMDCLSALQAISQFNLNNKLICDIRHALLNIRNRASIVVFEWIPGHCGIHGNEMADRLAKRAVNKDNNDVTLPLTTTEIKQILKEDTKFKWQAQWDGVGNSSLRLIKPQVSYCYKFWNLTRWQEIVINRLRLGAFTNLKSYQHKIGKAPDGMCDKCQVYDDVEHFMLACKKYDDSRNVLQRRLNYTTNLMTLKNILNDKSNLSHVIRFIQEC